MAAKSYTWNASDYAKNSANQYQWAKELFPKLHLNGGEALLDLGCGDGKITVELANALPNGKVVGVDSSKEMIALANKNFAAPNHPNLRFMVMDARALTFECEFDRVFSNAVLHWIVDQKPVLAGVHRSLRRGGRLLFQMAGKGNAQAIIDILEELKQVEPWRHFFAEMAFPYGFFSAEEYRTFLQDSGLEPVRAELIAKDMMHPNAEALKGWIRTTWLPFTNKLPEELKTQFVEVIAKRYLELHPADAEGKIHVGMMRLEVEATKP
jgi:trans-aconitate 2-methyltransferase